MKYIYILIILVLSSNLFADVSIIVPKASKATFAVDESAFKDAIEVKSFNKVGNTEIAYPNTRMFLKYDDTNLYALFICTETEKGYPEAYKRSTVSNLMLDDAVQIMLGTSFDDSVIQHLNMGGYEGAFGEVANADFYYQYTVNAENAKARTFNETALANPMFDSLVKKDKGRWLVAMKIPFASFGVNKPSGRTVFFNAFRSRPPELQGFYNLGFGAYTAIPFTKITFAKNGKGSLNLPIVKDEKEKKTPNIVKDFSLRYYPTAREISGQAHIVNSNQNAYISVSADGYDTVRVKLREDYPTNARLKIGDNPKLPITAICKVELEDGTLLKTETITVNDIPSMPAYLNTNAGKENAQTKTPSPWVKPVILDKSVKLVDKTISIGEYGLFKSVSADKELLAGDIKIGLVIDGVAAKLSLLEPTLLEEKDTSVIVSSILKVNDKNTLDVKLKIDFDGFTVVKIKSDDINPSSIDKLFVDIPMKKENAKFIHRVSSQTVARLEGFGWSGDGDSALWLGNNERGICFEYDIPVFLSENKRKQIEIKEDKDNTLLRLNFVDRKGEVKDKSHVFRFYLTPTPTKKYTLDKTGLYHGMDLWFEEWSDYQGFPDFTKIPKMKERNEKDEKEGKKLIIYFSQVLASNAPGSKEYFTDFTAYPERGWYKRAYNPGKDIVCYVSCVRDLYGDLLLDGIAKLVKETGVNSIYMDGPANPWDCINPSHDNCHSNALATWDDSTECPYEATRDFLKRMRSILSETGKPFKMIAHTGGVIFPSTMSLCDGHYEGEQMSRYKPGYRIPLDAFAVGYCGIPWGFRVDELPMRPIYSPEQMRTWALIHDSCIGNGPYNDLGGKELEEKIYNDFQDNAKTTYYPYWNKQDKVKYTGKSLLSFYLKDKSAMLIFGNLTGETDKVSADISKLFTNKDIVITDILTDKRVVLKNNLLDFDIKPYRFAVYRCDISDNKTASYEIKGYNPDNLKINEDGYGVKVATNNLSGTDIKEANSLQYGNEAKITFVPNKMQGAFYTEFKLYYSNIVCLTFGKTRFVLQDGAWRVENPNSDNKGSFNNILFQNSTVMDFKISLIGNELDMICNGKNLAINYKVLEDRDNDYFTVSTWNGDRVAVLPTIISNTTKDLIEIKKDNTPFEIKGYKESDWTINKSAYGIGVGKLKVDGKEINEVTTTQYVSAGEIKLNREIGDTFYADVDVYFSNIMNITVGNSSFTLQDGGFTANNLSYWNTGIVGKSIFNNTTKINLKISVIDDKIDLLCNDKVVAANVVINLKDALNNLVFQTWNGDKIAVYPILITSKKEDLIKEIHPVIK